MTRSSDQFMKYVLCGLCGAAFGIAAEKGRVHEPSLIRGQMDFTYFTMLKMFLGAAASGMVSMSLLSMTSDSARMKLHEARSSFMNGLRDKGFISSVLGGAVLGAGMTIAGTCPGMVLVQVGSQTHNALYTLAGGFIGVLLYTVLEPTVVALTRPSGVTRHERLDDGRGYSSTALPIAAVLGCAVGCLEIYYRPWTADVSTSWGGNWWTSRAWPPYVAGAFIGLLQAPLILTVRNTLGTSSSYCTVLSQCLVTDRLRRAFPYLAKFRDGIVNWWQVFFVGGAVVGSFLSAQASGSLGQSSPVSQSQAMIGGALMVFGARLAGGCTSGHGLSGMSLLVIDSFITTGALFAGAMATYSAMKSGVI